MHQIRMLALRFWSSKLVFYNFTAAFDQLSIDAITGAKLYRTTLAMLPFYHGSGFWALCYCIYERHRSIVMRQFHPMLMYQYIYKYNVSCQFTSARQTLAQLTQHLFIIEIIWQIDTLNVVPSIVHLMISDTDDQLNSYDLSSITTVLCGASKLGQHMATLFRQRFPNVKQLLQGKRDKDPFTSRVIKR